MKILPGIVLALLILSCSKEKKEEMEMNLVVQAMTSGQWKVTEFNNAGQDISSDFLHYKFQFHTDYSVEAFQNGSLFKTGSWSADANAQTITSQFSGASQPLLNLNGTWTITSTTWTSVKARQETGGVLKTLRLDKL